MSNQVTLALRNGEQARTPNSPGNHDIIIAPEVARVHEIDEADHNLDALRNVYDPQPLAATAMSTQIEAHPHATTQTSQFEDIMHSGGFDPDYLNAISGNTLGADMPVDTPRPVPVEEQVYIQPYQGV